MYDNRKDQDYAQHQHVQEIPIRYPDSVYEYHSPQYGIKWLMVYVAVISMLCCAAWMVLEMTTSLATRSHAVIAIAIGLVIGLPSALLFQSSDRKNRQATLRSIKTSR